MFSLKFPSAVGVLALSVLCAASNDFLLHLDKCHMTDTQCLVAQTNKFFQDYPHGAPAAGIPDLDPLSLEGPISVKGDPKAAANINLVLSDVQIHKYGKTNITSMSGFTKDTSKNMKLVVNAFSPEVIMKAKYKIRGKVLVLPIIGDGDIEMVLTGVSTKSKYILKPVERNGTTYLTVQDSKIQIKTQNIKMDLTNLFNGDPALSKNMLELLNENWRIVSEDVIPHVGAAIAKAQGRNMKVLMENIPYEKFFLPDQNEKNGLQREEK